MTERWRVYLKRTEVVPQEEVDVVADAWSHAPNWLKFHRNGGEGLVGEETVAVFARDQVRRFELLPEDE